MSITVGIDLGTTNSCVAVPADADIPGKQELIDAGRLRPVGGALIITDAYQAPITPSVVWLAEDGTAVVGSLAKSKVKHDGQPPPAMFFKRTMGTDQRVTAGHADLTPQQASTHVLRHLKALAEEVLQVPVDQAVVTVPAYFEMRAKNETVQAGLDAGLAKVETLIEPFAAALMSTHGHRPTEPKTFLVYDLGGGTFDISVVAWTPEAGFEHLAFEGDRYLGGYEFDKAIVRWMAEQRPAYDLRLEPDHPEEARLLARLLVRVESEKHFLSREQQTEIYVEGEADRAGIPMTIKLPFSRAEFEALIQDDVQRTLGHCDAALERAGLAPADLDEVVMVGGSSRVPLVSRLLRERYGLEPRLIDPDLCVAVGAGIKAGAVGVRQGALEIDQVAATLPATDIAGRVHLDADRAAPDGVRVLLRSGDGIQNLRQQTDAEGRFVFEDVALHEGDNELTITVVVAGEEIESRSFTVSPDHEPPPTDEGDVLAHDFFVELEGGPHRIAQAGTKLPYHTSFLLETAGQGVVLRVRLDEGLIPIGEVEIHDLPSTLPAGTTVELELEFRPDWSIDAEVRVPAVGMQGRALISVPREHVPSWEELRQRYLEVSSGWQDRRAVARPEDAMRVGPQLDALLRECATLLDQRQDRAKCHHRLREAETLLGGVRLPAGSGRDAPAAAGVREQAGRTRRALRPARPHRRHGGTAAPGEHPRAAGGGTGGVPGGQRPGLAQHQPGGRGPLCGRPPEGERRPAAAEPGEPPVAALPGADGTGPRAAAHRPGHRREVPGAGRGIPHRGGRDRHGGGRRRHERRQGHRASRGDPPQRGAAAGRADRALDGGDRGRRPRSGPAPAAHGWREVAGGRHQLPAVRPDTARAGSRVPGVPRRSASARAARRARRRALQQGVGAGPGAAVARRRREPGGHPCAQPQRRRRHRAAREGPLPSAGRAARRGQPVAGAGARTGTGPRGRALGAGGDRQAAAATPAPPGAAASAPMNRVRQVRCVREASSSGVGYERLRDRGRRALAAGNLPEAIDAFGDAVCLRPDLVTAHLDLGRCFQESGNTEVARRVYEYAARTDPASPLAAAAVAGLPAKPSAKHAFDLGQIVRSPDNSYRVLDRRMGAHGAVSIVEPEGRSSFFDRVGYRRYALKTFNMPQPWSDEDRERFANEAKTWVLLERHPNIVTALWVERVENHHCLLLEYVSGGDLDSALAAGPLGLERALRFGLQFCDGMEHASRTLGVMHGDVKAANCLLTEDDTLKVTDFGLAQVFGPAQAVGGRLRELKPHVRAIYVLPGGTRNYRAPEQSRLGARVDVRTDIYGFGVLLYQMVTGDLPVSGSIAAEHIRARTGADDLPAGLRELILACVEREPQRRPRSFRGLRGELQAVYEIVARRPAPAPAQPLPGDRDLYIRRGAALDELGRHEEALAWFGKALRVAPGDGWALHNKALTLIALKRPEEALACLDQALERYPGYTQALTAKARLLTVMGRHQEALTCIAQIRKAPALMGVGDLSDALGHVGEALRGGRPGGRQELRAPRHSPGTLLAWQIAAVEAKAGHAPAIEPAHLMLGVCKLGDGQGLGQAAAVLRTVPLLEAEIEELRGRFRRAGLEVTPFRRRLRTSLARPAPGTAAPGTAASGGAAPGGASGTAPGDGVMHRTPAARGVFRRAEELGADGADGSVGLTGLLRALLEIHDPPWAGLSAEMGLEGRLQSLSRDEGGSR